MKMSYDPSADAFYLYLTEIRDGGVHRSEEVAPATVLDYDEGGNLLGIEVYADVAKRVDLSRLITRGSASRRYGGRSGTSVEPPPRDSGPLYLPEK